VGDKSGQGRVTARSYSEAAFSEASDGYTPMGAPYWTFTPPKSNGGTYRLLG
jgi:hypothetical protein